jgi:metallo-beta-lactamase family protein
MQGAVYELIWEMSVKEIVKTAAATRSTILIPTFAVGRAQLLVVLLSVMFRRKRMKPFPIFLDSPMAIEATRIYSRHRELFDDEMRKHIQEKSLREDLKTLTAGGTGGRSCSGTAVGMPCSTNVWRKGYFTCRPPRRGASRSTCPG